MSEQRVFFFDYHRIAESHHWKLGKGHFDKADQNDKWKDQEIRFKQINEKMVRIGVFDENADNPQEKTFDYNDAEELADEEFARRFPGEYLH